MANPYHHAVSSVKKWGGKVEDYINIHSWFDQSKAHYADFRHRALRHHSEGIFQCEEKFGVAIQNSDGRMIPVRWVGEQHVKEDLGFIPTISDWFSNIAPKGWMMKTEKIEKHLDEPPAKIERVLANTPSSQAGTNCS